MAPHDASRVADRIVKGIRSGSNAAAPRLESNLALEVHAAGVDDGRAEARPLCGDKPKGGRIKVLSAVYVIYMVQSVDRGHLELKPDPLGDRDPFDEAQVHIEILRTIEAVQREIAECSRSRSGHESRL